MSKLALAIATGLVAAVALTGCANSAAQADLAPGAGTGSHQLAQ